MAKHPSLANDDELSAAELSPPPPAQAPPSALPQTPAPASAPAPAPAGAASEPETTDRFVCKICGRTFSTHQALGGHCAGHEKRSRTPAELANNGRRPAVNDDRPGTHVCRVCGRSYPSGQALGGHMRLHYNDDVKRRKVPSVGLNAPQAVNIGFPGSGSNFVVHVSIEVPLDTDNNGPVSNVHDGPEPVNHERSEPFLMDREQNLIGFNRSNDMHREASEGFGSNTDMRSGRSKSNSREGEKSGVFDENTERACNNGREKNEGTDEDGEQDLNGDIQFISGSNNRNREESEGFNVNRCSYYTGLNGSNNRGRDQTLGGSCLGSHRANSVDTELRLWFVEKDPREKENGPQKNGPKPVTMHSNGWPRFDGPDREISDDSTQSL